MAKIIGNTTATPNPCPDWNQTDEKKADYIKNKPELGAMSSKNNVTLTDLASDVQSVIAQKVDKVDGKGLSTNDFTDEDKAKLDAALTTDGGTISGNLVVTGDVTVNGTTISEDHETIVVEDNMVVLNSNKVDLQTALSGLAINKDGNLTYGAVYDPTDDTFKFGEGTLNADNEFEFTDGEGLPFAVRNDSSEFTDGDIIMWSAGGNKLVDSGIATRDVDKLLHPYIPASAGISEINMSSVFSVYPAESPMYIHNVTIAVAKGSKDIEKVILSYASVYDGFFIEFGTYTEEISDDGAYLSFNCDVTLDGKYDYIFRIEVIEDDGTRVYQDHYIRCLYPHYYGTIPAGTYIDESSLRSFASCLIGNKNHSHSYTTENTCPVFVSLEEYGEIKKIIDQNGLIQNWTRSSCYAEGLSHTLHYDVYIGSPSTATETYTFEY